MVDDYRSDTQPQIVVSEPKIDTDGVIRYKVTSSYQKEIVMLRFLVPKGTPCEERQRFLFVLPVEPMEESRYGDGLSEIRRLGLHEELGLIVVAPSFADCPWYADHPTDQRRADETYLLKIVVTEVDRRYPTKYPVRLLLGFSKSGWGAFTLILRNPDVFQSAVAWDAPLMLQEKNHFEMSLAFGTQAHFAKYQVSRLLQESAKPFRESKRLGLFGYGLFRDQMQHVHRLLIELKIPHDWADGPERRHDWSSGWLKQAVCAVSGMGAVKNKMKQNDKKDRKKLPFPNSRREFALQKLTTQCNKY